MKISILTILIIFVSLSVYAESYWVFFTDKDLERRGGENAVLQEVENYLSPQSIWRRTVRGQGITIADALPSPYYVNDVKDVGYEIIGQSRWLNAVIIESDSRDNFDQLTLLDFVDRIEPVNRFAVKRDQMAKFDQNNSELNYGFSEFQLSQVGITRCHNEGYRGEGVIIAILDSGFKFRHEALERFAQQDSTKIIDTWNYVDDTSSVAVGSPDETGHGTRMLGIIAGYQSGQLIGAAKNASFCLYKSELDDGLDDYIVEEHWWVLAAERADSAGADIISSSLAYKTYLDSLNWSYQDMNGTTAYASQAAFQAYRAGIVVVTAMSNVTWTSTGLAPQLDTCIKIPADADSIISAGGVDSSGSHYLSLSSANNRWYASACGPTIDGRTKPDLSASWWALSVDPDNDSAYYYGGGTSCATAITAGGVALLLQAHPSWNVHDVLHALKSTSSRSGSPNDSTGWGVSNFYAALHTQTPEVEPVTSSSIRSIYPNPFNPAVNNQVIFDIVLLDQTNVAVYVYTLDGFLVWYEDLGVLEDGSWTVTWDGKNESEENVASGLYFVMLDTGYGTDMKRMVVVR